MRHHRATTTDAAGAYTVRTGPIPPDRTYRARTRFLLVPDVAACPRTKSPLGVVGRQAPRPVRATLSRH